MTTESKHQRRPSRSEDSESSSSILKQSGYRTLKPRTVDLIPFIIGFVGLILLLSGALIGHFILKGEEIPAALKELEKKRDYAVVSYRSALFSVVQSVTNVAAMYNVSKTPITLRDQLVPFMYSTGQFVPFLWSISCSYVVKQGELQKFIQDTRALGGEHTNFNVTGRNDSTNAVIPTYDTHDHIIIMQTVPLTTHPLILGYDMASGVEKNATFMRVMRTKRPSATSSVILGNRNDRAIASSLYIPIFNQTTMEIVKMINGAIVFEPLTNSALSGIITDDIVVSIYDLGFDGKGAKSHIYTTKSPHHLDTRYNVVAYGNVSLTDRVLLLEFKATDHYLASFDNQAKWIPIIILMVVLLILWIVCVVIYFIIKLKRNIDINKSLSETKRMLTNETHKLQGNIALINEMQMRNRLMVDSFPYCVIYVRGELIIDTNELFVDKLKYKTKLESGDPVKLNDILPDMDIRFFTDDSNRKKEIKTVVQTGTMNQFNAVVYYNTNDHVPDIGEEIKTREFVVIIKTLEN